VLGVFLAQKLSGKPFTVVGDGNQTRDFTYVSDVVNALIVAAKSNISGNEYNVGSGKTISINYLTNLIGGEKVYIPKRPGEPEITFADIHKIKTDLGWEPKISIEDGIKKVIEHIDDWESAPVWTPETIEIETREWFRYLKKNS
jgi:UDP-glucose 4-epimerase